MLRGRTGYPALSFHRFYHERILELIYVPCIALALQDTDTGNSMTAEVGISYEALLPLLVLSYFSFREFELNNLKKLMRLSLDHLASIHDTKVYE